MISTKEIKSKYKISRQWLHSNKKKLKVKQKLIKGRAINFYYEAQVKRLWEHRK